MGDGGQLPNKAPKEEHMISCAHIRVSGGAYRDGAFVSHQFDTSEAKLALRLAASSVERTSNPEPEPVTSSGLLQSGLQKDTGTRHTHKRTDQTNDLICIHHLR